MHNHKLKPIGDKSLQVLFNDIAEIIRKYSKSQMSTEDSKRAARLLMEYIKIILQQQLKKKEEVENLKKSGTPVPVEVPIELLAQQQSKNSAA